MTTDFTFADGDNAPAMVLKRINRHGLITGATGTGKTVSLQVLAEGFSAAGVPVFAADIKGDLSGVSKLGQAQGSHLADRLFIELAFQPNEPEGELGVDPFAEGGVEDLARQPSRDSILRGVLNDLVCSLELSADEVQLSLRRLQLLAQFP